MAAHRTARFDRRFVAGVLALLGVGLGGVAHADDMVRCRNDAIIRVGMVTAEVEGRCGAPKTKSSEDVPVRVRNRNGAVGISGYTRVEQWTYDRGYGQFPALLTFEDGMLKNIELLTRQ